jgi:ABC-type phosphate transport system permease subunit
MEPENNYERKKKSWEGTYLEVLIFLFSFGEAAVFLGAVGTIGWQGFQWLKTEEWPSLPLTLIFTWNENWELSKWIMDPESWFGVHRIVSFVTNFISIPVAVMAICFAVFFISIELVDKYDDLKK